MSNYDVVIAGGGHNGLVCGAYLTLHGLKVLVAERNEWVGGGVVTEEIVLPGFKHDLFGANHIWCHANPDYTNVLLPELEKHGLNYLWTDDYLTGHPMYEGPGIVLHKDIDKTCDSIAEYSAHDACEYRRIFDDFVEIKDGFVKGFFSPPNPPSYQPMAMERSPEGLRMLREYNLSARAFVEEKFENEHVRAFLLGWSMGPHVTPDQEAMGASFHIMVPALHIYGSAIPEGGSMELPLSCRRYMVANGSDVITGATVEKFIVDDGECRGIRLENGDEILASRGVVTALDPKQTFLRLIDPDHLESGFVSMVRNFRFGDIGIFRVHYAVNEAPVYRNGEELSKTLFQRIFPSVQEVVDHFAEVSMKKMPSRPFLHCLCWTKRDPGRAPDGKHCVTIDTWPPCELRDRRSWEDVKEEFAATMLEVFREHTTNMDDSNILGYAIHTPEDLYAYNRSFYKGSPTGGERTLAQLGYLRPFPGYSQYRSPIDKLYMTGPSTHPGGGISAMSTITANVMLEDFGLRDPEDP